MATISILRIGNAQNYLQENILWKVFKNSGGDPTGETYTLSTYQISGDTIINDKNYKRLLETYDVIKINPYSLDTISHSLNNSRDHAIREENGAFYVAREYIDEEYLAVDFNLEIGDTIKFNEIHPNFEPDVVVKIDSFEYGNEFRKIYTTAYNYIFYEGIGTQFGPIQGLYNWGDEVWHRLLCVESASYDYLLDNYTTNIIEIDYCTNPINILSRAEPLIKETNVTISPNPSNDVINIETNEVVRTIVISSFMGNTVLKKENINTSKTSIDISGLNTGPYILTVENHIGKTSNFKIIKK